MAGLIYLRLGKTAPRTWCAALRFRAGYGPGAKGVIRRGCSVWLFLGHSWLEPAAQALLQV